MVYLDQKKIAHLGDRIIEIYYLTDNINDQIGNELNEMCLRIVDSLQHCAQLVKVGNHAHRTNKKKVKWMMAAILEQKQLMTG